MVGYLENMFVVFLPRFLAFLSHLLVASLGLPVSHPHLAQIAV
jgi:hypothetical protein